MRKTLRFILNLSCAILFFVQANGQSFNAIPSANTNLAYNNIVDFTSGISSSTFTIDVKGLNKSKEYSIYFRVSSPAGGFVATPMPTPSVSNINPNQVRFTCLTASNISSSVANRKITVNSLASDVTLAYNNSSSTGNPKLISFNAGSSASANDIIQLSFRIDGPKNLCVPGNSTGLQYGFAQLQYDIYENGVFIVSSGLTHTLAIKVKDALSFVQNSSTTSMIVYPNSSTAVEAIAANQFTISSNKNVSLMVKAIGTNFESTTTTQTIPVSTVGVKISSITNSIGNTLSASNISLNGTSNITIANSLEKFLNNNISISYKIANPQSLSNKTPAIYSTTLIYSVTQL